MKNNRGFTLIELLAIMVVLGVLLTIAVPNTIKMIEKSKKDSFNNDLLKLISLARAESIKNYEIELPRSDSYIRGTVINLAYIKTSDLKNSPYGVPYNERNSFVVITLEDHRYKYYGTLVACKKDETTGSCLEGEDVYSASFVSKEEVVSDHARDFVKTGRRVEPYIVSSVKEKEESKKDAIQTEVGGLMIGGLMLDKLREKTGDYNFNNDLGVLGVYVR